MFLFLNEITGKKTNSCDLKNYSEVTLKKRVKDRLLKWFLVEVLEWWRGERARSGTCLLPLVAPLFELSQLFILTYK